jgi:hypothetical protein
VTSGAFESPRGYSEDLIEISIASRFASHRQARPLFQCEGEYRSHHVAIPAEVTGPLDRQQRSAGHCCEGYDRVRTRDVMSGRRAGLFEENERGEGWMDGYPPQNTSGVSRFICIHSQFEKCPARGRGRNVTCTSKRAHCSADHIRHGLCGPIRRLDEGSSVSATWLNVSNQSWFAGQPDVCVSLSEAGQ